MGCIVTVRKRSCGKVMFLHLSVSHSVHRGGCLPGGCIPACTGQTPPPGRHPHCSGRYAAYWNAFSYYAECFTLRMNREGQGQVLGGTGYRLISRIRSCTSRSVSMGFSCERFLLDIGPGSAPKLSSVITSFGILF